MVVHKILLKMCNNEFFLKHALFHFSVIAQLYASAFMLNCLENIVLPQ